MFNQVQLIWLLYSMAMRSFENLKALFGSGMLDCINMYVI